MQIDNIAYTKQKGFIYEVINDLYLVMTIIDMII